MTTKTFTMVNYFDIPEDIRPEVPGNDCYIELYSNVPEEVKDSPEKVLEFLEATFIAEGIETAEFMTFGRWLKETDYELDYWLAGNNYEFTNDFLCRVSW